MPTDDKSIFSGTSKEFHETGAPLSKFGKIELAPSFRVVYPKRGQHVIVGIMGVACILCIILGAIFWTYFFHNPFRVNLDSGELLCSDVLMGLPVFFQSGEILFSQDIEDGSALFLLDLKENKKNQYIAMVWVFSRRFRAMAQP